MSFKNLNDQNLLKKIKTISCEERDKTTHVLHLLKEIEFRRLHLMLGYSSLFEYCLRELKYSESQAYRRISAMRLIRDLPQVEEKIKDGSLSLSNAAKVQAFFRQSLVAKTPVSTTDKENLIKRVENKSARECELELIKVSPEPIITRTTERIVSEDYTELRITIKKELKIKLERIKNLLSHQNPSGDLHKLLDLMCDFILKKKDPLLRKASTTSQVQNVTTGKHATSQISHNTRYISSSMKQEVYLRDKGHCTYTDHETHRRCESRHLLQYDHIQPLALNGKTSVSNLRLLCFQHHQLITEQMFGARSVKIK